MNTETPETEAITTEEKPATFDNKNVHGYEGMPFLKKKKDITNRLKMFEKIKEERRRKNKEARKARRKNKKNS